MAIPRIYQAVTLTPNTTVTLDELASHHVMSVLRHEVGDEITLFNDQGGEYVGKIEALQKKKVLIQIQSFHPIERESGLPIHLGQALALGDRMDFAIQKSVEMGVAEITPLMTERSNVKLDAKRLASKMMHWHRLIISACEQCGRNRLPVLHTQMPFTQWIALSTKANTLLLHPTGQALNTIIPTAHYRIAIGPEGGWSPAEITLAETHAQLISLGPRILRTETAAIATMAMLSAL